MEAVILCHQKYRFNIQAKARAWKALMRKLIRKVAKTPTLPNGIILMVFCKCLLNARILVVVAMMMAAL